jgi:hypothetical protein
MVNFLSHSKIEQIFLKEYVANEKEYVYARSFLVRVSDVLFNPARSVSQERRGF